VARNSHRRAGRLLAVAALARHPRQFPDLYRALISAGEIGQLGAVLSILALLHRGVGRDRLQQKIALAFVIRPSSPVVALLSHRLLTYVVRRWCRCSADAPETFRC